MNPNNSDTNMPGDGLAAGIAEIEDLLTRLSQGDTEQRAAVSSEPDVFKTMKTIVNQLADHIQQLNDDVHEMAIGLCQHYDTLNRIARGDFTARAAEDSINELVAKLGELINKESTTLTGVISRAQLAEEEAKKANQQLQDIVEFLPDATFVVNKDKQVIAWNRAIEKMTGLQKNEVMGQGDYIYAIPFYGERRPILIDLLDENSDIVNKHYTVINKEGRTLFTEAFVPSFRNGDSRYFWATASPLLDGNGNKAGAIESIRDITDYKRTQEEKSHLELQLHQAHMIESLMIRMGHDLKTPLTPLCILLPLIRERVTDPDLDKMLDICSKSALSIKELSDKTRLFVKLSSNIKPNELVCTQLSSAVDECLAACAEVVASKSIHCLNEIDPTIVVDVVPVQIQELFANLISNSIRYSPENGVIRIVAEQCNEKISVSVIDNGIGLAPDHLEHVFDEFFKVDESRHDLEASGLGLSICRRIVQNHHGSIRAESSGLGLGTRIVFTLDKHFNGINKGKPEETANE